LGETVFNSGKMFSRLVQIGETNPNCPTLSRIKALAIRARKIHIVGSPELKIEGTPVYLDVEGLPDNDSEPTARLDLPRWHTHP